MFERFFMYIIKIVLIFVLIGVIIYGGLRLMDSVNTFTKGEDANPALKVNQ